MAVEQRTTPEQRAALRARYLAHPGIASCTVCRESMELLPPERDTIGVLWTWRCPRASEHPRLRYIDHHADLDVLAALADADALAGALAEVAAWCALVEDTDHRLKRINGEDGWITFYTLPAGIWHRFLAAARGGDVRGIVAGMKGEKGETSNG